MQPKLNPLGLEDFPTRDVEEIQAVLARNLDVRYMRNLLNFTDRFRSPFCNEQHCPTMRQRWDKHIQDHHSISSNIQPAVLQTITPVKVRDQAISASPTLSKLRVATFITRQTNDARAAQTDLTSADLSRLDILHKKFENTKSILSPDTQIIEKTALRLCATRSVIPEKSFYKEHLKEIADLWLEDMPMHSAMTDKDKQTQENVINNLIEKVYKLAVDASQNNYEIKVKFEIDNCLKKLPMWSPGAENDKIQFTIGLKDNLWLKIKELNTKYLVNTDSNTVIDEDNNLNNKEGDSSHNSGTNTPENEVTVDANENEGNVDENIYEKEIINWLNTNLDGEDNINRFEIAELILKRLESTLNESLHNGKYKLLLKGKIFDVLEALPLNSSPIKNKILYLNRCAEELANRIISIRIKSEIKPKLRENTEQNALINRIEKVSDCLGSFRMTRLVDIEEEISSTVIEDVDAFHNNTKHNNIVPSHINKVSGAKVAKNTTESIKTTANMDTNTVTVGYHAMTPSLSGIQSVYTSKEYSFAATSTPKTGVKKDIPKLNAEEVAYMNRVADLIRLWINTLPKQYDEDKNYKETVIYDLAGDIMDEVKLKQLSSDFKSDSDKILRYITFRWLCRFDFFEDINASKPMVTAFLRKLKQLPTPKMTRPQHGSRQTLRNIKHTQSEMANEDFIPQGMDVLQDQISVWMNEQPSEIYVKKDKVARNKQIYDLALNLQDKLRCKRPDSEIERDINDWLKNVIKPKEKENIGILGENLKEKIKNAPQDKTLEDKVQQMKRERAEYAEARRQPQATTVNTDNNSTNETNSYAQDPDKTMKEFIMKFMEHNYDIDDPMARGAFSHLLKLELRKLTPQTRKEVYDNLSKSTQHEDFLPSKLAKELEYIKFISDWLKNIPIAASYNTVGNKKRVNFVNDLARNIVEAEDQRLQDPSQMDFDLFVSSVISESMKTYELPIPPEHKHNQQLMVEQLMNKIIAARPIEESVSILTDSSIRDDSVHIDQNLSEFIEQYIRINGREIADDEVKLEAWSARLLKEIKKMVHEHEDPHSLCKAQVYNRLIDVPMPGDESVRLFGLELEYVKEISEWLKNLPLLSIANNPEAQNKRIEMISELAEKMSERTVKKAANPNDSNIDKNTGEYISKWITQLPLDPQQKIVLPIVLQQLMNRIDRVNNKANPIDLSTTQSSDNSEKKYKSPKSPKERKEPCCDGSKSLKDPGKVVVDAIEHFANKLPIHGDKESVKAMKDYIAKNLYKKIGELNVDPKVFNDDLLYQEMFEDEIDTQLENVPQNPDLQNQRDKLKSDLINTILDAKQSAKANAAGENYKHKLETTIDASIPNPYQSHQGIDPGFEIYKNQVSNMFILENFDHSNDESKMKYGQMIRNEIDKYSQSAQNKNAVPVTKDQIYNELYSNLFKVPMPCGRAVTDEVEEIKTRCEIQSWFDSLPLSEPTGTPELLERDQIITTLAKRIHEMEKESKPNDKIGKEATKWLAKLPLQPGQEKNIEEYVNKLQSTLKSTAANRKCVTTEPKTQDSKVKATKSKGVLGTSQIAGPSSAGQNWVSPSTSPEASPCCTKLNYQTPAEAIIEAVEKWCQEIPLVSTEEENKVTRDNLTTRIIMKISELNTNPEYFDNDIIYCELLDEELDKLLLNLPTGPKFQESITARKHHLIEQLKLIKPLMEEEKAKHEYKEDLKNTVSTILKEPQNTTEDKLALFNELKNEIIENFVQYNYDRDDEVRKLYIRQVHDGVVRYFLNYRDQGLKNQDPLIVRNQLMCELSKIPIPSIGAIKDTVEEIKMKKEVEEFFESLPSPKSNAQNESLRKQLTMSLSKRLYDIEKSGHSCSTDRKMKSEISRCLKKLDIKDDLDLITSFVDKLRSYEQTRKSSSTFDTISLSTAKDITGQSYYQKSDLIDQSHDPFQRGVTMASSRPPQAWESQMQQPSPRSDQSFAPPVNKSLDQSAINYEGFRGGAGINSTKLAPVSGTPAQARTTASPYASSNERSLGQSDQGYQGFTSGVIFSSSAQGVENTPSSSQNHSVTPISLFQTPNFSDIGGTKLPQLSLSQFDRSPDQSALTSAAGPRSGQNISGLQVAQTPPDQVRSSPFPTPQTPCKMPDACRVNPNTSCLQTPGLPDQNFQAGPHVKQTPPNQVVSSPFPTPQAPCKMPDACRVNPNTSCLQTPGLPDQSFQPGGTPKQVSAGPISPLSGVPQLSEPSTPQQDPRFFKPYEERRTIDQEFSPSQKFEKSLGQSDVTYDGFSGRAFFKSSLGANQPNQMNPNASNPPIKMQGNSTYTVPENTQLTSSSLFHAPHLSRNGNQPQMHRRQINQGPNTKTQGESGASYEGMRFLIGERPHTLDSDGVCSCVKRILKSCKGRPPCSVDIDEFCDECGGFGPMWWRMTPGFIFY